MKFGRLAVALSFLASGLIVPIGSAEADPYGFAGYGPCENDVPCSPDDENHGWCFADLYRTGTQYAAFRNSARWALQNVQAQTVMFEVEQSDCYSYTDARIREGGGLSNDIAGLYICHTPQNNGFECAAADVIINESWHTIAANNLGDGNTEAGEVDYNRDLTACHEVGHSLGLDHHPRSDYGASFAKDCQVSDWLDKPVGGYEVPGWRTYNGHHRVHVNDYAQQEWLS